MSETILSIRNLKVNFYTYAGVVNALDSVNLNVYKEEVLGIVGETGCGKSTIAFSILKLLDSPGKIVEGDIRFRGKSLPQKDEEMRRIRGKEIAMIFQDPMTYLNPVLTIGDQITEAIIEHQKLEKNRNSSKILKITEETAKNRAIEMLTMVKMPDPENVFSQYPHELSGGMRQRVMIAMALSCNPKLLIADEATTFLDVTTQRQVLELLGELKRQTGISLILITHDLGIVAEFCDKVAVLYAGNIVEYCNKYTLFDKPCHPYTKGLLKAIPNPYQDSERLEAIPGSIPNLITPPPGCRFHPRCSLAMEICKKKKPPTVEIETDHFVSCHLIS